jgi:hypothetical protein
MSMSARDRKILLIALPLVVLLAYWFLLLTPKRQEASKAGDDLAKQEQRLAAAEQQIAPLESAKATFASDYTQLVKLGKAVPTRLDMPTVIVQLEQAAKGTGISFTRIAAGQRQAAPAGSPATPPAAPGSGNGSQPAAAGGAPAASGSGKTAETAGNAVNNANQKSASAEQSGVSPADTQTSTSARGAAAGAPAAAVPVLDNVPIELEFKGSFFRLADFFHDLKRFVHVANNRINVRGRLLTVESLNFISDPAIFPRIRAELKATVYLAPPAQGATGGATPKGPAPAAPGGGATPASGSAPAASTPTATATP